ncbi:MAG TPA: TolC family protein [Longimicrobiales bacterium]|nr:TolC family protein [Longimicrobiales bacterium]
MTGLFKDRTGVEMTEALFTGRLVSGLLERTGMVATVVMVLSAVPSAAQEPTGRVLTLREAVATALEENESLETARWGLEAAQAQAREAWGSIFPTANLNASYTRNLDIPTSFLPAIIFDPDAAPGELIGVQFGSENTWYTQVRADQPLFNAAAFLGVGAAGRYEALQQEVLRGEAQQVVTEARLRYYDVLLAQEQLRLTSNSVRRVERVLEETRSLNRAGLASEYDVLRLEVELANLQPNLARAGNASEAARRTLAVAMGVEGLTGVELEGSLLTIELPELPGGPVMAMAGDGTGGADLMLDRGVRPEALPAEETMALAARNRSDLRQLALTRGLRETERRVEVSQYLPRVSLFGTWTAQGQGDDMTFFGENRFDARAVGIEVSVPLFSGLQRPARVSRLAAVVEQVETQLDLARDLAANEVRTLLDQAREAHERAAAQRRAVTQATRGFEIARAEYTAGVGSRLQLTDAELALRQSEFNYAQAVYDYLTAQARLDAAIGVVPMVDAGDAVALQG